MNIFKTPSTDTKGQKARNHVIASRSGLLARPAPMLHADNPLLPDLPNDEAGLLPAAYQGQVLKVDVPEFELVADDGVPFIVQLMWDGVLERDSKYSGVAPIDPNVFPIQLTLPPGNTTHEGRHELKYQVNVNGNAVLSDPLSIYLDRQSPNGGSPGAAVILPKEIEDDLGTITREYLDANSGAVTITVPDTYSDRKVGDVITVLYGNSIPSAKVIGTINRSDLTSPLTVQLTEAHIGGVEGVQRIFYHLADRVGNVGLDSAYKTVEVVLALAPSALKPLTVPLGLPGPDGDDLIDPVDATLGVDVQVEPFDNFRDGDTVEVTWDGTLQTAPAVKDGATLVRIAYTALFNGNKDPKAIQATYAIKRGSRTYPEGTQVTVNVDLRTPGPDNPDEPDLVNPNLALATVQGAVSMTDNTLTEADVNNPATAKVTIYEDSKADDEVQFYWSNVPVPGPEGVYTVLGSEAIDFEIPFTIPWTIIEDAGNSAALPVRYSIKHPSINDAVVYSPDQAVQVSVTPVTLPKVEFLNLDEDFGNLNCGSIKDISGRGRVAEIKVSGGEPKLSGQILTFNFLGHNNANNTDHPATFTFTPTSEQADNGFVVYLDYEPLRLTRGGPGTIEYTATIDGFVRTSSKHEVAVWMGVAGGPDATCEFTRRSPG